MGRIQSLPDALSARISRLEEMIEAEDALYRFAAGQDFKDGQLLSSAFTDEAQLDFTQPARRFGVVLGVFRGRAEIVERITASTSGLQTHHQVTNQRISIVGPIAFGIALVEAQHVRNDTHLLLKNRYAFELESNGVRWALRQLTIETVWHEGDSRVLFE